MNCHCRAPGPRGRGFTLFEVVFVVGVALVVMGGVGTIILQSGRLFSDQVKRYSIDEAGRHLMDRLSEELRAADPTSIKPLALLNSTYVTFQKVLGFADGLPQLGLPATLELQAAPGETWNGKDDNGDGRIDEGFLVLTLTGGDPIRLAGNIQSVSFNPIPNGLSFTVTLGVTDHGRLIQKTFYQEVNLRN
jgi:type II secretory pathway pseudopilin PulG